MSPQNANLAQKGIVSPADMPKLAHMRMLPLALLLLGTGVVAVFLVG